MSEIDAAVLNWSDLGVSELVPTGTVTLLLADVEGSTRLWETQPDEMTAAFASLDRTLAEVVGAHGGVRPVEQGEGDSFVIAFGRASDAVACALDLQRAPLAPIRLRIGLHTGEVQLRDEVQLHRPTINRTARIRDLAHGGQTVLSGTTADLVWDRLPDEAWLAELGTHPVRDMPRPEQIVQLCHPDIRNEFPPLRTAKAARSHNLPAQLTSFVGRAGQIDEVRAAAARQPARHTHRCWRCRQDPTRHRGRGRTSRGVRRWRLVGRLGCRCRPRRRLRDGRPDSRAYRTSRDALRWKPCSDSSVTGKSFCCWIIANTYWMSAARSITTLLNGCPQLTILTTSRETVSVRARSPGGCPRFRWTTRPSRCSPTAPNGRDPLSAPRAMTPTWSPRSADGSTACRWRSNWRPRGYARCHFARSPTASTTGSGYSPAVPETCCGASRPCGPRWTGLTRC